MKTFMANPDKIERKWYVVDAEGQTLGRLASEVAKVLNTNQKVYSRYETAENEMPIRHIITLCKFYNVSADYILGFTSTPNQLPKE